MRVLLSSCLGSRTFHGLVQLPTSLSAWQGIVRIDGIGSSALGGVGSRQRRKLIPQQQGHLMARGVANTNQHRRKSRQRPKRGLRFSRTGLSCPGPSEQKR